MFNMLSYGIVKIIMTILVLVLVFCLISGFVVSALDVGLTFWQGFFSPRKTVPLALKLKADNFAKKIVNNPPLRP